MSTKSLEKFVLVLLLVAIGAAPMYGQVVYEILTGATETTAPGGTSGGYQLNSYWHDSRTESIYLRSELNAAGVIGNVPISAIAFKCSQVPGKNLENTRIRMKHTTATTLTTGY
ncbi:MAG: hypothetical protein L3J82_08000, partial [Planctomycetes bacterium]|nr:hypothetical protein [Planctomycetota bacterium]